MLPVDIFVFPKRFWLACKLLNAFPCENMFVVETLPKRFVEGVGFSVSSFGAKRFVVFC
jgi:hypothetical protein